jgi:hypothetical protein
MPKKTRKEKIASQVRHNEKLVGITLSNTTTNLETKEVQSSSSPVSFTKRTAKANFSDDKEITNFFKKDFRKSLFVITGILILEVSIYIAQQAGLMKFIHF